MYYVEEFHYYTLSNVTGKKKKKKKKAHSPTIKHTKMKERILE